MVQWQAVVNSVMTLLFIFNQCFFGGGGGREERNVALFKMQNRRL
jgi:hypothetical protein